MPYFSLKSSNIPDGFVSYQHFSGGKGFFGRTTGELVKISDASSAVEREHATLEVPGESISHSAQVRIGSPSLPLHVFRVLRDEHLRLKMFEYNPPLAPPSGLGSVPETQARKELREDVTFVVVPGHADPSGLSFKSLSFPELFIRHRNFHLWVEVVNDDLSRHDATFFVQPALAPPAPVSVK